MSFISCDLATTHPSLLESTTTGFPIKSGLKSLSQETKKLLQSMSPMYFILVHVKLSPIMSQNQYFRAGAGTVIYNEDGQILLFSRSDRPDVWQLQQGGMDSGEAIEETLWRELLEETALTSNDFSTITNHPTWQHYEYPKHIREKVAKPDCLGQIHRWFYLKLKPETIIDITKAEHPEFVDWKWSTFDGLIAESDDIKLTVYQELYSYFKNNVV